MSGAGGEGAVAGKWSSKTGVAVRGAWSRPPGLTGNDLLVSESAEIPGAA